MQGFLALAVSAGFASLLSPCVLPALPLAAGYFATRRQSSRSAALVEATLFAAGITISFTGIGLALSMALGASGINRIASNPWLNLFVAAAFIAFASMLLGIFSPRFPGTLATVADRFARTGPRVVAPLAAGLAFTLATLACTAPFVGPLLVAASAGEWTRPVVGMLVYSAAFVSPLMILALTPGLMDRVPRAGRWTTDLRIVVAALQIAAALKFIADAGHGWGWTGFGRELVLGVWVALAIATSAVIIARAHTAHRWKIGPARAVAAAVPLAFALWLVGGLQGRSVGALEAMLPADAHRSDPLPWIVNDLDTGLGRARAERRAVLVDFTGYSCGNCRWMESNMFTKRSVREALRPFVLVRLYTDGDGAVYARNQRIQESKFGTVALPLYAILDGRGEPRAHFVGIARDSDAFVNFLRQGAD